MKTTFPVLGPRVPSASSRGPEQGCFLTPGRPFPGGRNCLSLLQVPPVPAQEQLLQCHSRCYGCAWSALPKGPRGARTGIRLSSFHIHPPGQYSCLHLMAEPTQLKRLRNFSGVTQLVEWQAWDPGSVLLTPGASLNTQAAGS